MLLCIMIKHIIKYRFPLDDPELLKKWAHNIMETNFKPTQCSFLCSEHFVDEDYQIQPDTGVKLLKSHAFPTVFKLFPNFLQEEWLNDHPSLQKSPVNIPTRYTCNTIINVFVHVFFQPSNDNVQEVLASNSPFTDPLDDNDTDTVTSSSDELVCIFFFYYYYTNCISNQYTNLFKIYLYRTVLNIKLCNAN